ncbi:hypothetical protein MRX96_034129 [Rhipicephalus microplus]
MYLTLLLRLLAASSWWYFIATPDKYTETTPAGCFQGSPFLRSPVTSVVVWLNLLAPSPSFAEDDIHTSATFAKGSPPVFSLVRRRRRLVQPTIDIGNVHDITPKSTTARSTGHSRPVNSSYASKTLLEVPALSSQRVGVLRKDCSRVR